MDCEVDDDIIEGRFDEEQVIGITRDCLDALPLPLPLPVRVSRRDDGRLLCALDTPDAATGELYGQLLFRMHRREIAARRVST